MLFRSAPQRRHSDIHRQTELQNQVADPSGRILRQVAESCGKWPNPGASCRILAAPSGRTKWPNQVADPSKPSGRSWQAKWPHSSGRSKLPNPGKWPNSSFFPNRGVGTCEKCNVFKATKLARNMLIKPAGGETHIAD